MATATKKVRAKRGETSMEFLIVEDNGGEYYWTLLDSDGNDLGRSPGFASYEHAEDAAGVVRAGAGSAHLNGRAKNGNSADLSH
jgi:hypothetical protein